MRLGVYICPNSSYGDIPYSCTHLHLPNLLIWWFPTLSHTLAFAFASPKTHHMLISHNLAHTCICFCPNSSYGDIHILAHTCICFWPNSSYGDAAHSCITFCSGFFINAKFWGNPLKWETLTQHYCCCIIQLVVRMLTRLFVACVVQDCGAGYSDHSVGGVFRG